jgi:hypothetical protein
MDNFYRDNIGAQGITDATRQASYGAARAIKPGRARLWLIAMRALDRLGAATRSEAIAISGKEARTLEPRFSELIAEGYAETTGERRHSHGCKRPCAVLRLTDLGRATLAGSGQHD